MKHIHYILAAAIAAAISAIALAEDIQAPYQQGQMLMINERGKIVPEGYAVGISDIAEAVASQKVVQATATVVREAQKAAAEEVDTVVDSLLGVNAYAYCDDFVESLGGAASVSTNAQCRIIQFQVGTVREIIDGVSYSRCDIYYYFSEPMNQTPYVQMMPTLEGGATNEWTKVELQNTQALGTYVHQGVTYENAYLSYVWTLTELEQTFYRVNCEIKAAAGDGTVFDVVGGITVNGDKGDTATFVATNYQGQTNDLQFVGGLLKRITIHEENAE